MLTSDILYVLYKDAVERGLIFNGGTQCDSYDGPCSCGSWHKLKEAVSRLEDNGLLPIKPLRSFRLIEGGKK